MSGYTPLFSDIYMGTLYGKWPAAAVWASLLPLVDPNGNIDMSMQAIQGMTGWPMDLLQQGIDQLMQPDPNSRTEGHDGRRLVLIDPSRPWGWRAVNHGKYREKARLMSKNRRDVESGREAERKRSTRESAGVRRCPPDSPMSDPSYTNTDTNLNTEGESAKTRTPAKRASKRCPQEFQVTEDLMAWAAEKFPNVDINAQTEAFRDHEYVKAKTDWPAAWRSWIRKAADFSGTGQRGPTPRKTKFEQYFGADNG